MIDVLIKNSDKHFRLNDSLKRELDVALYAVKEMNQDLCIVLDGHEGSGKSQASRQLGYYCAQILGSHFDRDGVYNIHNDLDKYIDSCNANGKYYISILDESRHVLNSKRSMSAEAVRFTNFLSECRSKNQIHIIILPSFHDLDRYIAQWRMSILITMKKTWFTDDKILLGGHRLELGHYKGYVNNKFLRKIYDQKGFGYPKKAEFEGRFDNVEVLTPEGLVVYENQKNLKMIEKYGSKEEPVNKYSFTDFEVKRAKINLLQRFLIVSHKYFDKNKGVLVISDGFLSEMFDLNEGVVSKYSHKRPKTFVNTDDHNYVVSDLSVDELFEKKYSQHFVNFFSVLKD